MKPQCVDCLLRNQSLARDISPSLRAHLSRLNERCYCQFTPNKIVFLSHKKYMALGKAMPVPASLLAHMPGLERA